MSDNFDDIQEFVEASEEFKNYAKQLLGGVVPMLAEKTEGSPIKKEPKPGQVVQYELYGGGYKPANDTIKTLPPGSYDIVTNPEAIWAVPTLKPTGLLLELPEMRSDEVIKIVDTFWNSEKDYKEGNEFVIGGASFKAGIMLYGPPGTGKSCTVKIVSNKLVDRGGTVFFGGCNPHHLMMFLSNFHRIEPDRKCIVILEDIDSLIDHFGESAYLEMLDGAKTIDNVLFIATTNYPDRLDPRIYNRPGRFSHVVKIGLPGPAGREAYLKAILKNHKDVPYIVENTHNFSIDHLSALCNATYREKKNLESEIKRLKMLFKIPKIDDKTMGIGND